MTLILAVKHEYFSLQKDGHSGFTLSFFAVTSKAWIFLGGDKIFKAEYQRNNCNIRPCRGCSIYYCILRNYRPIIVFLEIIGGELRVADNRGPF